MKPSKKLLCLSLGALAMGLASCQFIPSSGSNPQGDSSAYGSSTQDTSTDTTEASTPAPIPTGSWTEDEENLMKANLNGHVLPYVELEDREINGSLANYISIAGTSLDLTVAEIAEVYEKAGYEVETDDTDNPFSFAATLHDPGYSYLYVFGMGHEGQFEIEANYMFGSEEWPLDQLIEFSEYTGVPGDAIPVYGADGYVAYVTSDIFGITNYSAIECYGAEVNEESTNVYTRILIVDGWTIDDTYYEEYGEMDATKGDYSLTYYFLNDCFYIYASAEVEEHGESEFPMEDLTAWLADVGAAEGITVPTYEAEEYFSSVDTDPDGDYGIYFEVWSPIADENAGEELLTKYIADAKTAGWTLAKEGDGEAILLSSDEAFEIDVWYDYDENDEEEYFALDILPYENPFHEPSYEGAIPGATSTLSFEDATEMVSLSEDLGWWNNHTFDFKVAKGQSKFPVGGDGQGFLANPLRTYVGQEITISSPIPMDTITFDWAAKKGSPVPSDPSVGSFEGNVLTLPEGTTEVTFSVAAGQIRFNSVVVEFSPASNSEAE
ncbi:MAG: hypothetical protein K6E59_00115 [Bacilli bacterium]|nr:hypothetical protein [Bacilli bacterium]